MTILSGEDHDSTTDAGHDLMKFEAAVVRDGQTERMAWPAEIMVARLMHQTIPLYGSMGKRKIPDPPNLKLTRRAIKKQLESIIVPTSSPEMPFLFEMDDKQSESWLINKATWIDLKGAQRFEHMQFILDCCIEQVNTLSDNAMSQYIQARQLAVLMAAIIVIALKTFNNHDTTFHPGRNSILLNSFGVYDWLHSDYWHHPALKNVDDVVSGPPREPESARGHPELRRNTGPPHEYPIQCEFSHTKERLGNKKDGWKNWAVDVYRATSGPDHAWSALDEVIIDSKRYANAGDVDSRDFESSAVRDAEISLLFDESGQFKVPCHTTQRKSGELGDIAGIINKVKPGKRTQEVVTGWPTA